MSATKFLSRYNTLRVNALYVSSDERTKNDVLIIALDMQTPEQHANSVNEFVSLIKNVKGGSNASNGTVR